MNKEILRGIVDCEDGLRRFSGNEVLFNKFVVRFLDDKNFYEMKAAIENQDYEQAFKSGHTLKGIAGNLSLISLFDSTCILVEVLRKEQYSDEMTSLLEDVTREYDRACAAIKNAQ